MKENPFTSDIFVSIWGRHFNQSAQGTPFAFIKDLLFAKHRLLPYYFNYGKTHTKGISYRIDNSGLQDLKGKVLLIYDVPTYFNLSDSVHNGVKQHKIKQYPGFFIDLKPLGNLDEYMAKTFKKSSRYKLKKYKRKLETCFDIHYKMFRGEISKEEYDELFDSFYKLLKKRFDDKQITNNNLEKKEWDFYYEVAYPMILEDKAGLFVIYNGRQPIGVTLCYFSDSTVFDAITVFDIDYSKFHLGSVTIMKLVEWSIEQNLRIFDFSKGYFDYKKRWSSTAYDFEYRIIYDSKSPKAKFMAWIIKKYFGAKQFLRDKKVNEKLYKFTFLLRRKRNPKKTKLPYRFFEIAKEYQKGELVEVDWDINDYSFLKVAIFDFLYLNNENFENVTLHQCLKDQSVYYLSGKSAKAKFKFSQT